MNQLGERFLRKSLSLFLLYRIDFSVQSAIIGMTKYG